MDSTFPPSSGLLVLGMHRSGTSALARVLGLCGADLGTRLVEASAGNEGGHWEDAFAVELHDRLLATHGAAWDDPLALPEDWLQGAAGRDAAGHVQDYLAGDRRAHPVWAAKDPRLCLFAPAWRKAAQEAGMPLAAVFLARHPDEVARSLAARDGIAHARGRLLWLDYTISALAAVDGMDVAILDYPSLLADWRPAIARIARLPGLQALQPGVGAAAAIDAYLDPGKRHQRSIGTGHADGELPDPIARAWEALRAAAADGALARDAIEPLRAGLAALRELAGPVLAESRQLRAQVWLRAGRAEAALADEAMGLPANMGALREGIDANSKRIVDAISVELRRMQEVSSGFQADAARHHLAEIEANAAAAEARESAAAAQRELMHARYELGQLQSSAREYRKILASRSWRWTRPLRVLGRLLGGGFGDADRQALDRVLGRNAKPAPLVPAAAGAVDAGQAAPAGSVALPVAAPQAPGLPDVFVWSVIDWYFRFQRPQHMAEALAAKGHRVFYVSNNFVDAPGGGFRAEQIDAQGRLFQVNLNLPGAPSIYAGMPAGEQVEAMRASLACVLQWAEVDSAISLVQHPFWKPLLRAVPDARLVYDCMDHHGGFADNVPAVLEAEAALVADADLVVVTSDWLRDELSGQARAIEVIRNAGEHAFFSKVPADVFRDPEGRRIIGYYGAIADWFDVGLVRRVAEAYPRELVLLVGRDTAGAGERLAGLANVRFVGEVAYGELPYWLHAFDACMLPFEVVPLTLATNPVKVYEYLAAGKPVVAVDLPEMAQFGALVRVAADPDDFVAGIGAALAEAGSTPGSEAAAARQAFAATQTWDHRAAAFDAALARLPEVRVSVVVLTWNNLDYTQRCLDSIERYSGYRDLEVIVVDNASTDGSRDWLRQWAATESAAGHQRRLILNDANLGFSAGNNVGLRAATGDVLVLLNNDTHVTPGWVRGLCNHLRDPALGLVGPVTNNIGNEARIQTGYEDMDGMLREAAVYTRAHPGERIALRTAAFFCVAMRRDTFERVGEMDEAFGVGFFEDDDYCRRVEQAGLAVACAEDVFVHHHLSASFDALAGERKRELFEANKVVYEAKWGAWIPHGYRQR